MKYRRKPEIVEAVQWWPEELHYAVYPTKTRKRTKPCEKCGKQVAHGTVDAMYEYRGKYNRICPGDWLVRSSDGIRAVTNEQFNAQFEPEVE